MSIKKNAVNNLLLTISGIVLPLITFPYITRILSNSSYGRTIFVDAFTQYFGIFLLLGVPFYGVREVAKAKNNPLALNRLVRQLISLNFMLSVTCCVVFFSLYLLLPKLHSNLPLVLLGCVTLLANPFTIEWYYQGNERFAYITIRSVCVKLLYVLAVILFVKHDQDYVKYALFTSVSVVVNAGINFGNFLKESKSLKPFAFKGIYPHIRPLLVLFSINISVSVYTILDTIILGLYTDTNTVSLYAVPLRITKMYWMLIEGIGLVLIPRITGLFVKNDRVGIADLLAKSASIVFLLTLPFCFFSLLFPETILRLATGEKYLSASPVLQILSPVPLIIGLCNVYGTQYLLPIGQERKILYATIAGFIVSLSFNFGLIPHLRNMGSAIACVLAEGTVCLFMYISARGRIRIPIDYRLVGQILCTIAISCIFLLFADKVLSSIPLLFVTAAVYVISFCLLQFFVFKNDFVMSLWVFFVRNILGRIFKLSSNI